MKKILILLFSILLVIPSYGQFGKILDKGKKALETVSNDNSSDIAGGLKEALNNGVTEAVETLSVEDGYYSSAYKVLIPGDAKSLIKKVSKVPGFKNVEQEITLKLNRASELAAKKATPIFIDAIKKMSISNAKDILMGGPDAATRYLESTARTALYKEFMPVIQASLESVGATKYWGDVVKAHNKIPFVKKANPNLDDHVNQKALDGLFGLVEKKEAGIRGDSSQRTSDLLKKVFSKQD